MRLFPSRRPHLVAAAAAFLDPQSSPRDRMTIAGIDHVRRIREGVVQWVPAFEVAPLQAPCIAVVAAIGRGTVEDAARIGGGL